MQVIKLRLKGFTGIKKGMGRDEIEIDFLNLHGLMAIAGPNGHGKTTILDNMHPFRTMPSRKKSLQHHVFRRDSEKELEFSFNSDHYRSLIKIDAQSDRTEGFLWKNGESLVDGKVTNYDQEIFKLFGSPELFFNSVFCAQNSKKLNEMTTGELKKLFSEFLRLDQLVDYENTSKQCAIILSSKLDALETEIDRLTRITSDKQDTAINLASSKTQLEVAGANLKKLEKERDEKQNELSQAQAAAQKNELLRVREKELKEESLEAYRETEAFTTKYKADLAEITKQKANVGVDIITQDSLLANEAEIRDAVEKVNEITVELENTQKLGENEALRELKFRDEYDLASKDVRDASKNLRDFQTETKNTEANIKYEIQVCKMRMVELEKKDPECTSTICSFIVGALKAKERLPVLEKDLSDWQITRRAKEEELEREVNRLQENCNDIALQLKASTANLAGIKNTYTAIRAKLRDLQPLAADLPKVEIATQRRDDLIKRQEELTEQEKTMQADAEARAEELRQKAAAIDVKFYDVFKQIDNEVEAKITKIQERIDELAYSIKAYNDTDIPKLKADIETHTRRLEEIEKAELEWDKAKALADMYKVEISEWTYLKNACSKDGLRALEIDSISPVMAGYANKLLLDTFGPTFSVRFRTQDEETGREILEILVISEDGSERLLDALSGGEKIWILQSLRLAMTLISKEKSGKNFLTGFADELDGPLDTNRAIEFAQMYRSFMSIGGFESFYFISHKPETISLADHIISLNGQGIKID